MKRLILIAALFSFTAAAQAQGATCAATSAEKKLAGAAKNSFMKKCETDAKTSCTMQADEKKIYGAAKNSFVKKCTKDAVAG
jgi:hypothetical protein